MDPATLVLVAESDRNDFLLTESTVRACGLTNKLIRFPDGKAILEFLRTAHCSGPPQDDSYLMILSAGRTDDDALTTLKEVREDGKFSNIPAILLATIMDPVSICHPHTGRSVILAKPLKKEGLKSALERLGLGSPVSNIV